MVGGGDVDAKSIVCVLWICTAVQDAEGTPPVHGKKANYNSTIKNVSLGFLLMFKVRNSVLG